MQDRAPVVSVIIPTYNHGHLLGRCIRSVLDQSFCDWEAIVVNNHSTDDTINVVNSFDDKQLKLVNFRNNGVIAASRNEGLRHSTGKFIAFLDSDDWWHRKKLERSMEYLTTGDVVYHDLAICGPQGKKLLRKVRGRHVKQPVLVDLLTRGNALPNSSVVVNKELILKAGGFDEDVELVACEDFDLWLRISRLTERFVYIPETLGAYWVGGQSMTEISPKGIERIEYVYNKHYSFLSGIDKERSRKFVGHLIGRIKYKMRFLDIKRRIKCYLYR